MLWINEPEVWQNKSQSDKLELLRKYYCTGPCGQSNQVIATRDATNSVLKEAVKELETYQFMLQVMEFFSEHDIIGILYWRCDGEYAPIKFFTNTNDLFCWGTADAEYVNPENFDELKKAVDECLAIDPVLGAIVGCELFACRMNKMRPQGAAYPENKNLWPLFDACGPEREISLGNPYKPGDYKTGS